MYLDVGYINVYKRLLLLGHVLIRNQSIYSYPIRHTKYISVKVKSPDSETDSERQDVSYVLVVSGMV